METVNYNQISGFFNGSAINCIPVYFTTAYFPCQQRSNVITGRNEVVAKVMFLQVSVIHSVHRGGSPENPPGRENPPGTRENPPNQADPPSRENPPRTRENPPRQGEPPGPGRPPPGRRLQHTVYERLVRILLECILVFHNSMLRFKLKMMKNVQYLHFLKWLVVQDQKLCNDQSLTMITQYQGSYSNFA